MLIDVSSDFLQDFWSLTSTWVRFTLPTCQIARAGVVSHFHSAGRLEVSGKIARVPGGGRSGA